MSARRSRSSRPRASPTPRRSAPGTAGSTRPSAPRWSSTASYARCTRTSGRASTTCACSRRVPSPTRRIRASWRAPTAAWCSGPSTAGSSCWRYSRRASGRWTRPPTCAATRPRLERVAATAPPARRRAATPARAVAYHVLRRVFEDGAWADRALQAAAEGLDPRERALATQLAYGAVQRAGTLDHVAARLAGRPVAALAPPVRAALRLGLYQLLFLDGIPDHAAVDSSVALAKADAPRAAGLVNAVLRRATGEEIAFDDVTPEGAALAHSVPL